MITTNRTFIRPIAESDAVSVFNYRSDSVTNKFQGWIPESLEEVLAMIARQPQEFNTNDTWYQLVIIETISNSVIGDIGVHFIGNDGLQCELGITLQKAFQGKGYAKETMLAVIDYLFKHLNKHRITTSIDPNNVNSIRLMERIGFRKEAHFKESISINGEWVDDVVYALLQKEFNLGM